MTEISAWASTRTESVRVRADETGVPITVDIEQSELRYGGEQLASTVLDLTRRAADVARARRRTELERAGVDAAVLDRMGLPSEASVARAENALLERDSTPTSWLRSV